jgi:hypothetical protein
MYIIGDQKISLSEANALAEEFDTTVEELAASGGWQLEEGKTTVPEDTTPPTEPEKKTAAGDSSLADTSLELPEANPYLLTLEDLEGTEEDVYDRLSSKMRRSKNQPWSFCKKKLERRQ